MLLSTGVALNSCSEEPRDSSNEDQLLTTCYLRDLSNDSLNTTTPPPPIPLSQTEPFYCEYVTIVPPISIFEDNNIQPQFPGGVDKLNLFLKENIICPDSLINQDFSSTVVIQFILDIDGCSKDFQVLYSDHDFFTQEAIRVLKLMPNWRPARIGNIPVRTKITVPIDFEFTEK